MIKTELTVSYKIKYHSTDLILQKHSSHFVVIADDLLGLLMLKKKLV